MLVNFSAIVLYLNNSKRYEILIQDYSPGYLLYTLIEMEKFT